jgi:hypothetical protein
MTAHGRISQQDLADVNAFAFDRSFDAASNRRASNTPLARRNRSTRTAVQAILPFVPSRAKRRSTKVVQRRRAARVTPALKSATT